MNFLSHFYHEAPCNDPYFAAGLLLPDILSNYSFRNGEVVKLKAARLQDAEEEEMLSLRNGVKQHYMVDGMFHESEYFEMNVDAIKVRIKTLELDCFNHRLYAFAHVMLELMLDRVILQSEPHVCDQLYNLIEDVDHGNLSAFISMNTMASRPHGVADHFHHFRKVRFLYDYMDDDRLLGVLGHINTRLGNRPFENSDRALLKPIIHDIDKTLIDQKFPKFRIEL